MIRKRKVASPHFETPCKSWVGCSAKILRIDYRYSAGDIDRLPTFAAELAALSPDALHSIGSPSTTALRDLTRTIPIVFAQVADPLGSGLIENMARPIANITGFTNYEYDIGGKWLEMLKEIAPFVTRVLVIHNSANVSADGLIRAIQVASASSEAQVSTLDVRQHSEEKRSVDALVREARSGLIVLPGPVQPITKTSFQVPRLGIENPPHTARSRRRGERR